jgi:uncharacterized membrane protein
MNRPRNADLLVAAVLAAVGALVVELVPYTGLRLVFALPMVFALPGYGLVAAAFGRQMPEPVQRAALTLGLSLAVSILGALVLDLTSGLTAGSWTALIFVVVGATCAVAVERRRSDRHLLAEPRHARSKWRVRPYEVWLILLAVVITVSALVFAATPLPAKNVQGYTSLSMLQDPPRTTQVMLQVKSAELRDTAYSLELRYDSMLVYAARRIVLQPGQRWQRAVVVAPSLPQNSTAVEATLVRLGSGTSPYRTVRVWLGPMGSG